jgi:molecular chaperone DnaJ
LSRIQTTCSKCKGSGGPSCKTCDGRQHDLRSRSLSVWIPSNARDRMRVRIRGQGKAVMGGESGDLYIKVRVQPEGQPSGAGAAPGV